MPTLSPSPDRINVARVSTHRLINNRTGLHRRWGTKVVFPDGRIVRLDRKVSDPSSAIREAESIRAAYEVTAREERESREPVHPTTLIAAAPTPVIRAVFPTGRPVAPKREALSANPRPFGQGLGERRPVYRSPVSMDDLAWREAQAEGETQDWDAMYGEAMACERMEVVGAGC